MANPCIASLDVGTTAVKVCLFSEQMELLECANIEYVLSFPSPEKAEAEASVYLNAIREGFRKVLSSGRYKVKSLGLTTQGETLTAVDKDGSPMMPFIVWLDHRAQEEADQLKQRISEEEFYRLTGLPAIDGALPLCKLMWIQKHLPEIYEKAEHFLLLEDYLLLWLTGNCLSEKSLQTSTGWFSLREDGYSAKLLNLAGISGEKLPPLVEPGTKVGTIRNDRAQWLGLPENLPVVCGAMDQTAAAYAMGSTGSGIVTETTGTALTMAVCTDRPDFEGSRITVYRHVESGKYLYLPIGNTGGRALTWLRDSFFPNSSYRDLTSLPLREKVPAGSEGLVFLPFLSGIVDPDNVPNGKACFYGISLSSTAPHFVRAVMEGVACELCDFIHLLEQKGCRIETVFSLGGGSASPLWMQMKANISGKTFLVPKCSEAAAMGAAMLASTGTALSERDAPKTEVRQSYQPTEDESFLYKRYQKVYAAILPLQQGEQ